MCKLNVVLLVVFLVTVSDGCAVGEGQGFLASSQASTEQSQKESMQEQIEKEKWARIRAEEAAQARKNAIYPMQFEMIALRLEKKGIYNIMLVFQPGNTSLSEFERELRENVTGEIEIRHDNLHYKTIRFEDYAGFTSAPVGNGYGPVYSVKIEYGGFLKSKFGFFDFYPRVRAKKPYAYALAIKRQQQGIGKRLDDLFLPVPPDGGNAISPVQRPEFQILARLGRFDMFMELGRDFNFDLGIRKKKEEKYNGAAFYSFNDSLRTDYSGDIDVYRNNKLFRQIDYGSDSTAYEYIGIGAHFKGFGYRRFEEKTAVWYSFLPKMLSTQQGRSFAVQITTGHMGK